MTPLEAIALVVAATWATHAAWMLALNRTLVRLLSHDIKSALERIEAAVRNNSRPH